MAVTINIGESLVATIKNGTWSSRDAIFRQILATRYNLMRFINYTPWPDYTLAEMACKVLGGKIVKATDPPEYVEGRVY